MLKKCGSCQELKPSEEFHRNSTRQDGYSWECRTCHGSRYKKYRERPEVKARLKVYNKEHNKERNRYLLNKSRRLRFYGVTPDQYDALLAAQGGLCAICREPDSAGRDLAVDHCHVTGRVRGLLCGNCNAGIGRLRDSPLILAAAIQYLVQHEQIKAVA